MDFKKGDMVKVVKKIGVTERECFDRIAVFLSYTSTHRYASVHFYGDKGGRRTLIHPEALELHHAAPRDTCGCGSGKELMKCCGYD
jgi:uncharacterized protein YchJ